MKFLSSLHLLKKQNSHIPLRYQGLILKMQWTVAMVEMFLSPLNSYVEILTPSVTVLGGPFGT